MKTADELLNKLATDGGVIVSTARLSGVAIAQARACGRMYVDDFGLGFVHYPNADFVPRKQSEACAHTEVGLCDECQKEVNMF